MLNHLSNRQIGLQKELRGRLGSMVAVLRWHMR